MGLYTMNYYEDLARREKVIELMKKDDWRGVVDEFQVPYDYCFKMQFMILTGFR